MTQLIGSVFPTTMSLASWSGAKSWGPFASPQGCLDLPRLRGHPEKHESAVRSGSWKEAARGSGGRFSAQYKAEAVRMVGDSGESTGAIARELGLGETALRRWVQQARTDAGRGPTGALTTSEREELGQFVGARINGATGAIERGTARAQAGRARATGDGAADCVYRRHPRSRSQGST